MTYVYVMRYVPDVVRGEMINFGVLIEDGGKYFASVLRDTERLQAFGCTNCENVLDWGRGPWTEAIVASFSANWLSSLQLSKPMASVLKGETALAEAHARYLGEPYKPAEPSIRVGCASDKECPFCTHVFPADTESGHKCENCGHFCWFDIEDDDHID